MRCARRLTSRAFVLALGLPALSAPGILAEDLAQPAADSAAPPAEPAAPPAEPAAPPAEPAAPPAESAPPAAESAAPAAPKLDITGFVDVFYEYSFNRVDPAFRAFDIHHNAFSLSLAEVAFAETVSPANRLGFRVDLNFGETADLVAALEPEENGQEIYKHFQQAYLSLLTGKVQWDVGRFVTPMGAEVIESQDNWNYTRSILFGYAIPFNHTGLRATVPVSGKVSLTGFLLNGWNNGTDLSGDKTVALGTILKPHPSLTWNATYMGGREVEGGSFRSLFDTTATVTASSKVSLMANFDYGQEGDVKWWGLATYAKLQALPNWSLAGRYEFIDDTEGGFMLLGTRAQSLTLTSDHLIAGALKARVEYRTDFADDPVFPKRDGALGTTQTTLAVGLVYGFNRRF
jgi:hypothetical protein